MNHYLLYIIILCLSASTAVPVYAQQRNKESNKTVPKWLIDSSHSNIGFTVNHLFTPVRGHFNKYSSDILFDINNIEESIIEVIIDVKSINTNNERRDKDLCSINFFHVDKLNLIIIRSIKIQKIDENNFKMTGMLSIKDVVREIELPFALLGMRDHYRLDDYQMAGISAKTRSLS